MSETSVLSKVMLKVGGRADTVIFRNNTGMAWQGKGGRKPNGTVVLHNPRPVHFGLIKGSSDLVGWKTVEITPDMVGKRVAVFVAIETKKDNNEASDDQSTFIANVRKAGGIAGTARTETEADALIDAGIK